MSVSQGVQLSLHPSPSKRFSVPRYEPYYRTSLGAAYLEDARNLIQSLPANSIDGIITSPPYALHFQKEYGNVAKEDYVAWFLQFAREFHRVLKDDGRFVLNIGGSYNDNYRTRSVYFYELLNELIDTDGV